MSATFFSADPVLSIISPMHCEGPGVSVFLDRMEEVLAPLRLSYEIILVDDGSTDDTWQRMRREATCRPSLRCLRLSRNFGKEAALVAGIEAALGRAVITLDGDLQHPPELIPEMVGIWQRGEADLVEARKEHRQKESALSRFFAGTFYSLFAWITSIDLRNAGDFKLLDRKVVEAWKRLPERRVFFRGMSGWVGFRRAEIPFEPAERRTGVSQWSFIAKLVLALDSLSAYTAKPLSLIWLMGAVFAVFAVLVGGEALWAKFSGSAVTGFTTVVLVVLITGAAILGSICLLSLYIRQIFHEVKLRPRYLVGERTDEAAVPRPSASASEKNAYSRRSSRPLVRVTRHRPRPTGRRAMPRPTRP